MNTPVDENELLSIEQLCDRLFISATTAYKLLQSGEIKAFKVGTWKIPVKSVNDYIKRKCADQKNTFRTVLTFSDLFCPVHKADLLCDQTGLLCHSEYLHK